MKTKMAFITSVVLFAIFTVMLLTNRIGELSYFSLNALSVLTGVIIHGFDRLKEIDFKNLKMVLNELKQTKEELFVREEKLKEITFLVAQIMAVMSATRGQYSFDGLSDKLRSWYQYKLAQLKDATLLEDTESRDLKKPFKIYEELLSLFKLDPSDEKEKRIKELEQELLTFLEKDMKD